MAEATILFLSRDVATLRAVEIKSHVERWRPKDQRIKDALWFTRTIRKITRKAIRVSDSMEFFWTSSSRKGKLGTSNEIGTRAKNQTYEH
jgi:hypothetical protein